MPRWLQHAMMPMPILSLTRTLDVFQVILQCVKSYHLQTLSSHLRPIGTQYVHMHSPNFISAEPTFALFDSIHIC